MQLSIVLTNLGNIQVRMPEMCIFYAHDMAKNYDLFLWQNIRTFYEADSNVHLVCFMRKKNLPIFRPDAFWIAYRWNSSEECSMELSLLLWSTGKNRINSEETQWGSSCTRSIQAILADYRESSRSPIASDQSHPKSISGSSLLA